MLNGLRFLHTKSCTHNNNNNNSNNNNNYNDDNEAEDDDDDHDDDNDSECISRAPFLVKHAHCAEQECKYKNTKHMHEKTPKTFVQTITLRHPPKQ